MTSQPSDHPGRVPRTPVGARRHRVHWFAGRAHEVLDGMTGAATWAMTVQERGETLAELVALRSRIDAQVLALVAEVDRLEVAAGAGAVNTAGWVRSVAGVSGPEAAGLVRRARVVQAHPATGAALASGAVGTEQALVVVAAVDALPEEVADRRGEAEAHLLERAVEGHDARALRVLGEHLLEVVAPDCADELIARRLAAQEAEALGSAYHQSWSDGHGSRYYKGKLPELHASMWDAMLEAIANPSRPDPIPRAGVSSPQVRGRALCELLERYPVDRLPTSGGVTARVVVTMSLDSLLGGLRAAGVVGSAHRISPGQARRLAVAAGVIPAVLGGHSQLLDLGRRRGFSEPQRVAMALRQGGLCNIAGCDRPATWADANHRTPWSQGGPTTIENGELICPRHHTLVHQGHHYPRRT